MNPSDKNPPIRYRDSWLVRIGALLLLFGTGPLLGIILVDKLGLTHDPDPNPVFFGILAGLTCWPGLGLFIAGILTVRRNRK